MQQDKECNGPGDSRTTGVTYEMALRGSGRDRCHDRADNAATNQEILVQNEPGVERGQ